MGKPVGSLPPHGVAMTLENPTFPEAHGRQQTHFPAEAFQHRSGADRSAEERTGASPGSVAKLDWIIAELLPADIDAEVMARRGAEVVATDLSPTLVDLARARVPSDLGGGRIDFRASDMLDPALGTFDWVVAMDSLIHYVEPDMVAMITGLASRAARGMLFTFAPSTPLLSLMWVMGKAFPRSDRSPAIEPIAEKTLSARLLANPLFDTGLANKDGGTFRIGRSVRVDSTFYISQAMELVRS